MATAPLPFAADTHPGRKYQHNEDSIGWLPERGLFLVADGMGGHASGEVASRIVAETILGNAADASLTGALLAAHRAVVSASGQTAERKGMGSTGVVARIERSRCDIAWVGDSRAYLFRRDRLTQLTRDHSYVELLLQRGEISIDEARQHPDRNLVTQTLGIAEPTPSELRITLRRGDRLLLCSDGLNDELSDDEIADVLRAETNIKAAVDELIRRALAKGGRDNISVIIIGAETAPGLWHRLSGAFARLPRVPRARTQAASSIWWPLLLGWVAALILFFLWYGFLKS
jgi:PPM family protein phosphatase